MSAPLEAVRVVDARLVEVVLRSRALGPYGGREVRLRVVRRYGDPRPGGSPVMRAFRRYEGDADTPPGTIEEAAEAAGVPVGTAFDWFCRMGVVRMQPGARRLAAEASEGGTLETEPAKARARRLYVERERMGVAAVAEVVGAPESTVYGWLAAHPSVLRDHSKARRGARSDAAEARRPEVWRLVHAEGRSLRKAAEKLGVSVRTVRADLAHPENPFRSRRKRRAA